MFMWQHKARIIILAGRVIATILAASVVATTTLPVLAQPLEPEPILVLNSQWDLAYANSACESAAIWYRSVGRTAERLGCENLDPCPKMLAAAKACRAHGAIGPLRDFEQRITASLAADPACQSIRVVRYSGPGDVAYEKLAQLRDPMDFWTLSLNFAPGAAKQPWQLQRRATSVGGNDEPQMIASRACASIRGRGGD